ncbi:hypothetical protein A2Y85_08485 [candidate division WOR-3 bacterium RBG_13_43_14]|uniref:Dihydroorotase n=1 Tax=candidate division WOR-3 bacterium RBG_13_43_14 TaxID=1802590 RepID=A0A1F4UEK9_UNCW3|nr:MAG: hypothetical protein A2Y85_08485 [candidate division WOR-3 bacterium RBG_13_43_14]
MREEKLSDILIKGGRISDQRSRAEKEFDVLIINRKIAEISKKIRKKGVKTIDAGGCIIAPGFIDLHCHLRDPGRPDEETIESGSRAAVAGGFTTLCCMPNTEPAIDNEGIVNYIYREANRVDICRVFPIGAITKGRQGKEITEFGELVNAGVKGFSDDGDVVDNANVFRHALEYSKIFKIPIMEHPLDKALTAGGLMNEGLVSGRLGLHGSPAVAEEITVSRDIRLAHFTGARLHLCHISTRGAVEIIRKAKSEGLSITCETCPHYFFFNDEVLASFDTNFKVNPPIRTEDDRLAVIEGLRDGTIDCIATDHAPHSQAEKELEFTHAPYGMTGLETALSLIIMELINKQKFTWSMIIEKLNINPAKIINEKSGYLKIGDPANITVIDPEIKWKATPDKIYSRSINTPLINKELQGKCRATMVNGIIKHFDE